MKKVPPFLFMFIYLIPYCLCYWIILPDYVPDSIIRVVVSMIVGFGVVIFLLLIDYCMFRKEIKQLERKYEQILSELRKH